MNQNEFNIHLAKRLGISLERTKELTDEFLNTLHFFVKKKDQEVTTKIGTFKIQKSRNGFRTIILDERINNADTQATNGAKIKR